MHKLRPWMAMFGLLLIAGCSQPPEFVFLNSGNDAQTIKVGRFLQTVAPTETSRSFVFVKPSEIVEIIDAVCRFRFQLQGVASDAFGESWNRNLGRPIAKLELSSSKELVATLIDNPSADVGLGFPLKSMAGCETVAPE